MSRKAGNNMKMAGGARCGPPLEPEIGEHIGRELREIYDEVVSQPVPERFFKLLNGLESGAILDKEVVDSDEG